MCCEGGYDEAVIAPLLTDDTHFQGNHNYLKFMKSLMRHLTSDLKAEDVKALSTTLSAIQNERLAAEKAKEGVKSKKKSKGACAVRYIMRAPPLIRFCSRRKEGGGLCRGGLCR